MVLLQNIIPSSESSASFSFLVKIVKEVTVDGFIYKIIYSPSTSTGVLALRKWIRDETSIKTEIYVNIYIY